MNTFHLSVLAANEKLYEGPCESLVLPSEDGSYGVQAHHSDLIAAVYPGEIQYRAPGEEFQIAAVSEGIVKIEDNDVLVLVDTAERPEEIDENRARREAEAAQEVLLQSRQITEYRSAQAQLARAISRMKVKGDYNATKSGSK